MPRAIQGLRSNGAPDADQAEAEAAEAENASAADISEPEPVKTTAERDADHSAKKANKKADNAQKQKQADIEKGSVLYVSSQKEDFKINFGLGAGCNLPGAYNSSTKTASVRVPNDLIERFEKHPFVKHGRFVRKTETDK